MDRAGLPVPGVMIEHGHTVDTADGAGAWHQKRSHMSQLGWGHHGVAHCHHRVATGLHLHVSAVVVPVRSLESVAVSLSGVLGGCVVSGAGTGPAPAVSSVPLSLSAVAPAPAPGAPGTPCIPSVSLHTVSCWTGVASMSGGRGLVSVGPMGVTLLHRGDVSVLPGHGGPVVTSSVPRHDHCYMIVSEYGHYGL